MRHAVGCACGRAEKPSGLRKVEGYGNSVHIVPVAMDGRRNFYKTYVKEDSEKIDEYLGDHGWRNAWMEAELPY